MYCHNCGSEVPSGAKFCHNCGQKLAVPSSTGSKQIYVKVSENGVLTITRRSNLWKADVPVDIYIDDIVEGSIRNGETLEFILSAGTHAIDLSQLGVNVGSYLSDIRPGGSDSISFEVTPPSTVEELVGNNRTVQSQGTRSVVPPPGNNYRALQACPRCGGPVTMQTVTESKRAGCLTVLLYLLLAATILGLFIVVPLMLRKKTETVTYAVCQSCGHRRIVSRS